MVADVKPQRSILEILKSKPRTLSAEIIPPRNGMDTEVILRQISKLREVPVDFISVTKGAGGSLRGGTLPIAQMIKNNFDICSLAHFTCRDYTIEEIENNLMDHHYFGVSNILALRGDPPDGIADHFKPSPNRHTYAWQLVKQIKKLNDGDYIIRDGFDKKGVGEHRRGTPTRFCIGVAAHPEQEPFKDAVEFLGIKAKQGAQFAITQMIFQSEPYIRFIEACAAEGTTLPVIPGLRIITQAPTAHRMIKKFGVKIPNSLIEKLENATSKEDARKIGLEFSYKLSIELLRAGAPGIHAFVMNDENTSAELLVSLK